MAGITLATIPAGTFGAGQTAAMAITLADAFTAVGAVTGAVGAVSSGVSAQRQMDFQAGILRQQRDSEIAAAADREEDFRRQQARQMASRRALMGATGVEATEGSPLLVSEDLAGEVELQALRLRHGGQVVSDRLEQQARLQQFAGRSAQREGFMRGGALLLSGAGNSFGRRGITV